jgi:signal transduction histidine kinase
MPEGGTLTITTAMKDEHHVKIEFQDSGMGISPENLDKIYNPFFSTKSNGTGLGLSISKEIVAAHQGEMTIDSEPEEGTTVIICLPVSNMGWE